jgi:L-threonylcarbamoyladenylate synthase
LKSVEQFLNNLKTQLIKINPNCPAISTLKKAAAIIKKGGLVVLPTDTVYGLACDATNPSAVKKLFHVKKRPLTQPLSIAVSKVQDLKKYAKDIPGQAVLLAKKFLPGPITLVVQKSSLIPDIVTAGRDDIGIRIPDSKIILMLIKLVRKPIVIPSANIHGKPSSTTAWQAIKHFLGNVDLILDGGKTKYAIESTIVSLTNNEIKILREGAISANEILSCVKSSHLSRTHKSSINNCI